MSILAELNFSRRKRLPVILAAEAAECGLACLAMVGCYYGHDIDLNGLRQRFVFSMSGASLRSLITLADQLDLGTRALRVEMEMLRKVQTPAVLHWDLNHFVVLKSVNRNIAIIHDPARGVCTLTLAEASKHFTGVVLELSPSADFQPLRAKNLLTLTRLWSKSAGFWLAAAQVLGLSAALQIATFAAPFQIQLTVDEAIGHADGGLLTVLAIGFGALVVIQALVAALREWTLQLFGNMLTFQIVGNLVRHLLRLPSDFFEKRHIGDILSRLGSTAAIQDVVIKGALSALIDGVMAIVALAILIVYSPLLTVIVILAIISNLVTALVFYPVLRGRMEEQLVTSAKERSHLMESVRAATTIKLMGREAERESAWRNLYAQVINATVSLGTFQIGINFLQVTVTGISTILVLYFGAHTIIVGGGFSVGMLLAFLSFRQTLTDRTNSLINQGLQFRLLGLHMERLSDIVNAQPETTSITAPSLLAKGAISVCGVSFRYGSADPLVLKDIDLEIAAGEFIAITGPSGGGKTTLTKLLLGLHEPTQGRILLDGQVATPELWREWRTYVGLVAQDDRLLSGSIADNIAFFDPDLDMKVTLRRRPPCEGVAICGSLCC